MLDPIIIVVALACGLLVKRLGFPPMLGYLVSGFGLHAMGMQAGEVIISLADAGIMLLLFTIGLKLNLRDLAAPQVWGVGSIHMLVSMAVLSGALWMLALWWPVLQGLDATAIITLAFALAFSSTVLAVKIFDEQGASAALFAKLAIGILIVQDLVAVVYMAFSLAKVPDPMALLLLLLIPCRGLLYRLMAACGHGELLLLFGVGMAFGGAALFEGFYLKGDIGALAMGILLGGGAKSKELAKALLGIKELFLVGFFVAIGLIGLPSVELIGVAIILTLLVLFKPILYYGLFAAMRLRARTSLRASLALLSFSEFGLIVAGVAADQGVLDEVWVATLAVTVALSFFIAVPVNSRASSLYARFKPRLMRFERSQRLSSEAPINLEHMRALVLGMGRVGKGAFHYLEPFYPERLAGIEENEDKLIELYKQGLNVFRGDASDRDFWEGVNLTQIDLIMLSLTNHSENVEVVKLIRELGYQGKLAVIARFPDELHELEALGCISYNLYAEAGHGFAEHVRTAIAAD